MLSLWNRFLMSDTNIEFTVDASGLQCPLPLLKTRQALRHMQPGQLLEVIASDPGSAQDIPAYLRQSNHQLVRSEATGHHYRFLICCGTEAP